MITDTRTATASATLAAPSTVPSRTAAPALDLVDFFSAAEARTDQWRQLCAVTRVWQAAATHGKPDDSLFANAVSLFGQLAPLEAFFAYPGQRLMGAIEQSLADRNAAICVRLAQHVSTALLTGS
jgi:arginine decarboxylase